MERLGLENAAFEGDNNAYLFADGPETVLLDTGDWTETTRRQLEAGLADHGVGFADIDRVLLTHWHHDHTGLAGEIQAASGAPVHVHEADAPLVAGDEDAWSDFTETHERLFEAWGMPESGRETLREFTVDPDETGVTPEVTPFGDGDTFSVGGRDIGVVHASGHAAGLCLFERDAEGREAFAGDALLPVYTPNVGGADVRVDRALEKYLRALDRIADADYARVWPGHRDPIEDPTARAEEIIGHHEERAYRVLDALDRKGPCDVWTVSDDLFGDLEGIHVLHGPGESYAHLEHLRAAGTVVAEDDRYRLADGVAGKLSGRETWPLAF